MRQLALSAALLIPLGVDTFALAAALGAAGLRGEDRLRVSLVFTAFEAGMPIVGVLIGQVADRLIGAWAGYGAVLFLFLAGVLLLRPGDAEDDEERRLRLLTHARGVAILGLGLSISVDELTIGVSAGLLGLPVPLVVVWVGLQAFLATQIGLRFGARIGERIRERSERLAGVALIGVAILLLVLKLLSR
ncbi:MAG TPA: manganese efflux pump [Candidatus Dormibacteraeota bacterium]|nr:manganese efflux pump [Candidatus Dormibacteraeota bacterium]